MEQIEKTKSLLINHCKTYPKAQLQDIFKYIYQSSFGCEHMVTDLDSVTQRIEEEYKIINKGTCGCTEELDGAFCRVPLSVLNTGISADTLGKLFFLSAEKKGEGMTALLEKLDVARELITQKKLPFDLESFDSALSKWKDEGYPAIHHSDTFREEYSPSYRVIAKEYVPALCLFAEIDKHLEKGEVKLAIEGGSASGKTTLADTLSKVYDCNVFHMDDFFLQPHQRTPERYAEIGGNIDRERFIEEVLEPLNRGEQVKYRKFDCSKMALGEYIEPENKKLTVIEGAYSMHPEMADSYDLSVFLSISKDLQKERIKRRNTPEMAKRFFSEWIPLEELYFSQMYVEERCSMVIRMIG